METIEINDIQNIYDVLQEYVKQFNKVLKSLAEGKADKIEFNLLMTLYNREGFANVKANIIRNDYTEAGQGETE